MKTISCTMDLCRGLDLYSVDILTLTLPIQGTVTKVVIYNRLDAYAGRLANAQIKAGGILCGTVSSDQATIEASPVTVTCSTNALTNVVTIETFDWLNLAEVELFGCQGVCEGMLLEKVGCFL